MVLYKYQFMYNDNIKIILFCEIIINRGVLIFVDFVVHVKLKNQNPTKYNFPIDFAYCAWNHEFKNPRITVFCRNHEYWC
jgi:hypothetical protein